MEQPQVLEGTWEEIKLHDRELAGRFLRVIVEPEKAQAQEVETKTEQPVQPKKLRGYGMFAHIPGGSEEFAREKQKEIELEERKFRE